MKVKEVAELVGISVRTLHHYDDIGLLKPETTESGYRIYSEKDLETLQQILFFKKLVYPFKKRKEILNSQSFVRGVILQVKCNMLLKERTMWDSMLAT